MKTLENYKKDWFLSSKINSFHGAFNITFSLTQNISFWAKHCNKKCLVSRSPMFLEIKWMFPQVYILSLLIYLWIFIVICYGRSADLWGVSLWFSLVLVLTVGCPPFRALAVCTQYQYYHSLDWLGGVLLFLFIAWSTLTTTNFTKQHACTLRMSHF